MKFDLFCKPRYSVCEKCRVHFEPIEGHGSDLCENHRAEWLDRYYRQSAVSSWVEANWERLEKQMKKERDDLREKQASDFKLGLEGIYGHNAAAAAASAAQNSLLYYGGR